DDGPVSLPRQRVVLVGVGLQARQDFRAQLAGGDDVVDDEVVGDGLDVDVAAVLVAFGLDEGGALLGVSDLGDVVGVDGVDGGLGAHDGNLGAGEGEGGLGLEGGAAHGVDA